MNNYPIITKNKIEKIALRIIEVLEKKNLANDLCIYFNNKRILVKLKYNEENETFSYIREEENNIDPHRYLNYCPYNHIISISTEGGLYHELNYGSGEFPKTLENLFNKTGIYYERGESWNLSFYPIDDDMKIEYTKYEEPPKVIYAYYNKRYIYPEEIKIVMEAWYALSEKTGDIGGCVIGAYLEFKFKGNIYKMDPCSPYQGEGSWTSYVDIISNLLKGFGATEIKWNPGHLD